MALKHFPQNYTVLTYLHLLYKVIYANRNSKIFKIFTYTNSLGARIETSRTSGTMTESDCFKILTVYISLVYESLRRIARERLAKHVPERYAVNENRRPLLDNGLGYHGITGVSGTTQT
jgi:hypothetical protein